MRNVSERFDCRYFLRAQMCAIPRGRVVRAGSYGNSPERTHASWRLILYLHGAASLVLFDPAANRHLSSPPSVARRSAANIGRGGDAFINKKCISLRLKALPLETYCCFYARRVRSRRRETNILEVQFDGRVGRNRVCPDGSKTKPAKDPGTRRSRRNTVTR